MNTIISSEQALGQKQVIVRLLSTDNEMQACVRLQQPVWQSSELEVVPHHIFIVAQRIGGQVLGAFEGSQMLGFVLAFPGVRTGRIYLHSHMTAVLPEHQNRGIGRQLKLAQRDDALARGIDLIEWTFDPLQLRNAYFNIVRLGVIVRQYLPNVYGRTTSSLDAGLPTDRLVAQWWIREPDVRQVLGNQSLQAVICARFSLWPHFMGRYLRETRACAVVSSRSSVSVRWISKSGSFGFAVPTRNRMPAPAQLN